MALPFAVAITRALGTLVNAFKSGSGKVSIKGMKLTKLRVNRLVERSFNSGGFRKKGKVRVNKIVDAVTVDIKVTYTDRLDRFLLQLPGQLDKAISEAAELIKQQSFALVPKDTGRLEGTGRVTNTSGKGKIEYAIGYGPAFDPDTGVDYTLFIHFGVYNRGPGTLAKNLEAGPLFLTRPMQQNTKVIMGNIKAAVRRAMLVA